MESQQSFPKEDYQASDFDFRAKIWIERQLLVYVDTYLNGQPEAEKPLREIEDASKNFPTHLIVAELAERFAVWFDSYCDEHQISLEDFIARFDGFPQEVLAEMIAPLGYGNTDEYLRELEEWFRVKLDANAPAPRESMLSIPLAKYLTSERVNALLDSADKKSA